MKQTIKKLLRKTPLLFYGLKKIYHFLVEIILHIKRLFNHNYELYEIFDEFCKISGMKTGNLNVNHIDEQNLNTNYYDDKIEKIVLKYYQNNQNKFLKQKNIKNKKKNFGIVFTEIYAVGGHTPIIERLIDSLKDDCSIIGYATMHSNYTNSLLKQKIKVNTYHWLTNKVNLYDFIINLYNKIIEDEIDIIYTCLHPHDIVAASVLCLLKKYTNVKIIQFNLADHLHYLGFKFAHLIIDARPAGQNITRNIRGYKNTILMPLQQRKKDQTVYYSKEEKQKLRQQLKIQDNEYLTLTGTADYKIFEDTTSIYFEMIKDLLIAEPKLKHLVMTEFDSLKCRIIFNQVFKNNQDLLKRLIIIDRVSEFDIYMQTCDLFIDSFPQGGALIHIDTMRNKKPTVLKINKENPVRSFEYYLPKDYEYQYNNVEDMKKGILKLLYSKTEQQKASEKLYQYYLDNYEFELVKKKYKELINESDNLEQFFGRNFYEN